MIALREIKTFPLGEVRITPPAETVLQNAGRTFQEYLDRHATCDWGELDIDDWNDNDVAVSADCRMHSVYKVTDDQTIWIITEADRSATTILLPDDY